MELTKEQLKTIEEHQKFLEKIYQENHKKHKIIKEAYEEQEQIKPQAKLSKLLKHLRRTGMRLDGHEKVPAERKCICGEEMNCVNNGFWECNDEQRTWNIIFKLLKVK